jgi:hypothetical protein
MEILLISVAYEKENYDVCEKMIKTRCKMFEGFSQATIDFMWNIRLNNNKEWFEAHKDE